MAFRNHYLLDGDKRICYVYIRKNACSIFKKMILDRAPEDIRRSSLSKIQIMHRTGSASRRQAEACRKRIFVFRDPVERVISGFLNQFVQKLHEEESPVPVSIRDTTGLDPASMDFGSFVRDYLCKGFQHVNGHFYPVVSHLAKLNYTDVMLDTCLADDARVIFGDDIAQRYFSRKVNATSAFTSRTVEAADKLTVADLHAMLAKSTLFPTKASFMTPELTSLVRNLYRKDQELYVDYLQRRQENGNRPVAVDMTGFDFSNVFSTMPHIAAAS